MVVLYTIQYQATLLQKFSVIDRATETIVRAQGKYKKWGSYYRLCERILRHLALKCVPSTSEVPFVHAYSTTYLPLQYNLLFLITCLPLLDTSASQTSYLIIHI